jgi:hypothetical protein
MRLAFLPVIMVVVVPEGPMERRTQQRQGDGSNQHPTHAAQTAKEQLPDGCRLHHDETLAVPVPAASCEFTRNEVGMGMAMSEYPPQPL